jgi:drug/metabolite transporter (DMT)-like permease
LTAVALALGASLGWGIADFTAGLASRRTSALVVLWTSQWIGLALAALAALAVGLAEPTGVDLLYAVGAGIALTVALGALYRAMAVGAMAIAAPVAATGVVIPVVVGLAGGDTLSLVQGVGVAAALVGVILCSREPREKRAAGGPIAAGVGLALVAAIAGGLTQVCLAGASSAGVLWVLLVQRAIVGALALTAVAIAGGSPRPARELLPAIVAIGVIDLVATGLFTAATIHGEISVVAVVGSLYPIVTVMLAFAVLSERLAVHQTVGVFAALGGVAAISGG